MTDRNTPTYFCDGCNVTHLGKRTGSVTKGGWEYSFCEKTMPTVEEVDVFA